MKVSETRANIAKTALPSIADFDPGVRPPPGAIIAAVAAGHFKLNPLARSHFALGGPRPSELSDTLASIVQTGEAVTASIPAKALGPAADMLDGAKLLHKASEGDWAGMMSPGLSLAKTAADAAFPDNPAIGAVHAVAKFGIAAHKGDKGDMLAAGLGACGHGFAAVHAYLYPVPILQLAAEGLKVSGKIVGTGVDLWEQSGPQPIPAFGRTGDQIAAFKVSTASA